MNGADLLFVFSLFLCALSFGIGVCSLVWAMLDRKDGRVD